MKPSVGRVVHYRPEEGDDPSCEAAIVTWIGEDGGIDARGRQTVSLAVFVAPTRRDAGMAGVQLPFVLEVLDAPEGDGPTEWHWPERVE